MMINSLDFLSVTHLHVKQCLFFHVHMGSSRSGADFSTERRHRAVGNSRTEQAAAKDTVHPSRASGERRELEMFEQFPFVPSLWKHAECFTRTALGSLRLSCYRLTPVA